MDNAILGFECIHELRRRNRGRAKWAALKLDMSKAYDRVEWSFLREIMIRLGFAQQWVDLILRCVSSISFTFNLNGEKVGQVIPSRGLRQGDPLSPYLFLLCAEGLSSLLRGAEQRSQITGFRIGRSSPSMSHLFFADDNLLFFRANGSEASVIRGLLIQYERASGQTINYEKSVVAFSPNTGEEAQQYISQVLSVPRCPCHQQYLGLPSFMPHNRSGTLKFIKDRIWRQIQGWRGKFFSLAGKEVLLKSIVQAIPYYTMNCFRLPRCLIKEIHRTMAKFWWNGSEETRRIHWVSWDSLCQPKCMGGLGFRNMELFNQALFAKQYWRVLQDPSSLLCSVLKGRYFPQSGFLEAELGSRPSFVWRNLLWGRELLARGCR